MSSPQSGQPPVLLVSFDIDGTMEFGDPPGPVSTEMVRLLALDGAIVGCASDRTRSNQQDLWRRHGIEPGFFGGKHHLSEVRAAFPADRYVHFGDTDVDEQYATLAGFEFITVHGDVHSAYDELLELHRRSRGSDCAPPEGS